MKKTIIRQYAKLIAVKGVNIQKGQEVMIHASVENPEFVKMLVEECYRAGAGKVIVEWSFQPLAKLHYRYRSLKTLSKLEDWEVSRLEHRATTLPAMIYIESDDPDGLAGINQVKMAKAQQATYPIIKPFRDRMENRYQWCIAAIPGEKWAKKMFPGEKKNRAIEKLWEAILETSRVNEDPIEAWEKHNADLKKRCDYLNSLEIDTLHYTADNGSIGISAIEDNLANLAIILRAVDAVCQSDTTASYSADIENTRATAVYGNSAEVCRVADIALYSSNNTTYLYGCISAIEYDICLINQVA